MARSGALVLLGIVLVCLLHCITTTDTDSEPDAITKAEPNSTTEGVRNSTEESVTDSATDAEPNSTTEGVKSSTEESVPNTTTVVHPTSSPILQNKTEQTSGTNASTTFKVDPKKNQHCDFTKVNVTDATEVSLKISWDPIVCDDVSGVFIGKGESKHCEFNCSHESKKVNATSGANWIKIEELCDRVTYQVSILNGEGEAFLALSGKTIPKKPAAATDLEVEDRDGTDNLKHIDLKWNREPCPKNIRNVILYKELGETKFMEARARPPDANEAVVQNLTSWTDYAFKVKTCLLEQNDSCSESDLKEFKTTTGIPEAPNDLRVVEKTNNSISISWTKRKLYGVFKQYRIDCGNEKIKETVEDQPKYTCEGLKPYATYNIRVAVENTEKHSLWSKPSLVATTDVGSPGPVKEMVVKDVTKDSLKVEWKAPDEKNGPIDYYDIQLFEGTVSKSTKKVQNPIGEGPFSEVFTELSPYTEYRIVIIGVNKRDPDTHLKGEHAEIPVRTKSKTPNAPKDLKLDKRTNHSISFRWTKPEIYGKFRAYRIDCGDGKFQEKNEDQPEYTCGELEPNVDYSISVAVDNTEHNGPFSKSLDVKTDVGVPGPVQDIMIHEVTKDSFRVQWKAPAVKSGPIDYYVIKIYREGQEEKEKERNIKKPNEEGSFSETYTNLTPYTNYRVEITGVNIQEQDPNSHLAGVASHKADRTLATNPDGPCKTFDIVHFFSREIKVKWTPPEEIQRNGPIDGYILEYKAEDKDWTITELTAEENKNMEKTILGLTPYTKYQLRIKAYNLVNDVQKRGPEKETGPERTDPEAPTVPQEVKVKVSGSSKITVSWKEPLEKNGPIDGYRVETGQGTTINMTGDEHSKEIVGLEPYTEYSVTVLAFNKFNGDDLLSNKSEAINITTFTEAPSEVTNLTASTINSTSIKVEWGPVEIKNGPIGGYYLQLGTDPNSINVESDIFDFELTNLEPYTNYTISVWAFNPDTSGQETALNGSSLSVSTRTYTDKPSECQEFKAEVFSSSTVQVTWKEPLKKNGPIDGYLLRHNGTEVNITDGKFNKYDIGKLEPFIAYKFEVLAYNLPDDGSSETLEGPLRTDTKRTDPDKPSKPEDLKSSKETSTTIELEWSSPTDPSGPITEYRLEYKITDPKHEDEKDTLVSKKLKEPKCKLEDLIPWRTYNIKVLAVNYNDRTDVDLIGPSTDIEVITRIGVPKKPESVAISIKSSEDLEVKWTPVRPQTGPTNYTVALDEAPSNQALVCTDDLKWKINFTSNVTSGWESNSLSFANLTSNNCYRAKVISETESGPSPHSEFSPIAQTLAGIPEPSKENQVLTKVGSGVTQNALQIFIPKGMFTQERGRIKNYALLIGPPEQISDLQSNGSEDVKFDNWYKATMNELKIYRASPDTWDPYEDERSGKFDCKDGSDLNKISGRSCMIGVETDCKEDTYCNGPLRAGTMYSIKFRAYTSGGWADTAALTLQTAKTEGGSNMGAIVGSVMAFVCLAVLVMMFIYFDRRYNLLNSIRNKMNRNHQNQNGIETNRNHQNPNRNNQNQIELNNVSSEQTSISMSGSVSGREPVTIKANGQPPSRTPTQNGGPPQIRPKPRVLQGSRSTVQGSAPLRHNGSSVTPKQQPSQPPSSVTPKQQPSQPPIPSNPRPPTGPIEVCSFEDYFLQMNADSALHFDEEFEELKNTSPKHSCESAEHPDNKSKNRWINILPFDRSRVMLQTDEYRSDYINANYIPGHNDAREYIATQGPLPNTLDDFWRMIWEQRVPMIVMVTQCIERGKVKCEEYWPQNDQVYGDIKVTKLEDRENLDYTIRIFKLTKNGESLKVKQMHFNKWPDFGCPDTPELLINFVGAVRDHIDVSEKGPITVHCSAGVGRTGTFIAVDRLMHEIRDNRPSVNVHDTVMSMRNHRTIMVQTPDQYIYIHKCVRKIIEDQGKGWKDGDEIYQNYPRQSST